LPPWGPAAVGANAIKDCGSAKVERTIPERISPAGGRLTAAVRPDGAAPFRRRDTVFLISVDADLETVEVTPTELPTDDPEPSEPLASRSPSDTAENGSLATISGRGTTASLVGGFLLVGSGPTL
jgi:hypothetical protein